MAGVRITEAELIEAIRANLEPDEDGFLTVEVADALGCSKRTARRYVKKLIADGVVEPGRISRRDDWGRTMTYFGYRFV